MLIDDPSFLTCDPLLFLVGALHGNTHSARLSKGVYLIPHFGSTAFPGENYFKFWDDGYEARELSISTYGVCDTVEQVLEQCPELQNSERQFVLTVTPVIRANQDPIGGWRWHKWGPYIGTHEPQHEYLYDEKGIDQVLVYHIYERKPSNHVTTAFQAYLNAHLDEILQWMADHIEEKSAPKRDEYLQGLKAEIARLEGKTEEVTA